jgi:putative transposase
MKDDTTITPLHQPGSILDPLTEIAREGARQMLAAALRAEAASFVAQFEDERLPDGRHRVVRHGTGPERMIQTGIGPIPVQRQKVRDRAAGVPAEKKDPLHLEHPAPLGAALEEPRCPAAGSLPARDFHRGFPGGADGAARDGRAEPVAWRDLAPHGGLAGEIRPLAAPRSLGPAVRLHLGGRRLSAGPDGAAGRVHAGHLGATPEGRKELVGFQVGVRESAQSWRELLVDIKARGLSVPPEIAVGDGAMGFWKALDEVFPGTRHQRCWVHKTANVLNKVPKSMQPTVKGDLREIWQAETRAAAAAAMDTFAEKYGAKYEKAVSCLTKDREALLAFYDFPAEHWDHLRTGNPIESVFATVRHRTVRTKGALSQKTAKLMVFKLVQAAAKTWRRLQGANQLPMVIEGVTFTDGVADRHTETRAA